MPRAAKIYAVKQLTDGRLEVQYAAGQTPLPSEWTGSTLVYESREALQSALESAQNDTPVETLVLIAIAEAWTKADPALSNPSSVKSKEVQLDLIGGMTSIRVK